MRQDRIKTYVISQLREWELKYTDNDVYSILYDIPYTDSDIEGDDGMDNDELIEKLMLEIIPKAIKSYWADWKDDNLWNLG